MSNNSTDRVLIFFSDLDGTITPITPKGLQKYAHLLKSVEEKQGAVVVEYPDDHHRTFTGNNPEILSQIKKVIEDAGLLKYFISHSSCLYGNIYILKDEYAYSKDEIWQNSICKKLCEVLEIKIGKEVTTSIDGKYVDVTPRNAGKEAAIKFIMNQYSKKFNIAGVCFSGDADSDVAAAKYLSRLALIPGIKSNVFTPANSKVSLEISKLEEWKLRKGIPAIIKKATKKGIDGIIELIEIANNKNDLVEKPYHKEVKDDLGLLRKLSHRNNFERVNTNKKIKTFDLKSW